MSWHCLLFEANSIQSWVFGSGRLRHIVGGSRIISGLTGELLDAVSEALAADGLGALRFARRAGGAFYAFSEQSEALDRLAQVWPLFVERYAPGLSYSMGAGVGQSAAVAFEAARADLRIHGQRPWPSLPQATPVMQRAPRTGRAAVAQQGKDLLDSISRAQSRAEGLSRAGNAAAAIDPASRLAALMGFEAEIWPRDMEAEDRELRDGVFPYLKDENGRIGSRYVALVHADGNGLGQILSALHSERDDSAAYLERFLAFSEAIEAATLAAAEAACQCLLDDPESGERQQTLPARPVILGGDDLTFIVRADLALEFTRRFLLAFEDETRKRFSELGLAGVEGGLTACAGLAYLRSNQPFYMGVELAESLCQHAKAQVRAAVGDGQMISALALYKCTESMIGRYGDLVQDSLTVPDRDGRHYRLTMESYALRAGVGTMPPLSALLSLHDWLEDPMIARGPGQLMGLIGQAPGLARQRYRRWLEIVEKRSSSAGRAYHQEWFDLLNQCAGEAQAVLPDLPFIQRDERLFATPLGDALALKSLACRSRTWAIETSNQESGL